MIVESMILINLFITLSCVWIAMVVNSQFLRPAILNRKRFALYELRDKLALLAMRGVIDQKSEEYITLLRLMNNSINSTKEFRITRFLKMQSSIIFDEKMRQHLDNILEKIKGDRMPDEYRKIVSDFFKVALEIYKHKTWVLRTILYPLIFVVAILAHLTRVAKGAKNFLVSQKERINDIENELEQNVERFAR